MNMKITKRNGNTDVEVPDGRYNVNAIITVEKGVIKYIDDGTWTLITRIKGIWKN